MNGKLYADLFGQFIDTLTSRYTDHHWHELEVANDQEQSSKEEKEYEHESEQHSDNNNGS